MVDSIQIQQFPSGRPPLVLVVDDVVQGRALCAEYLELRGFRVVTTSDGLGAVDMALALRPDVILMDLSMPVIDGWEATRRLKADAGTRDIPVIALTAHAMAGDRQEALDAGCDDYDTKPVELPHLLAKIEALLAKTAARP